MIVWKKGKKENGGLMKEMYEGNNRRIENRKEKSRMKFKKNGVRKEKYI